MNKRPPYVSTAVLIMALVAIYAMFTTVLLHDALPGARFGYLVTLWVLGLVAVALTWLMYREGPILYLIVLLGVTFEKWLLPADLGASPEIYLSWVGILMMLMVLGILVRHWRDMRSLTGIGPRRP